MTAMPEIITAVADKATDKASAAMTIPKRASSIARELNHQLWASYKTQGSFGPLFGEFVFEQFGRAGQRPSLTPPDPRAKNYMYYRGGVLKFGKLTMEDTDLLLVDANQNNPFDFSPAEYNRQLVAGYSKNTPGHGLIVYMPDLSELNARTAKRAP